MSKEAMKLALEALDIVNPKEFAQADPDGKIDKAITALRLEIDALNMASTAAKPDFWEGYVPEPVKPATEESSATQAQQALDKKAENARELGLDYEPAQQEPVAWLHTKIEGVAVSHRPADLNKHPDRWEALYKTPPPCPTCEALARTVMMDQTGRDA